MRPNLSLHALATTVAALGTSAVVACGNAAPPASPVNATEVPSGTGAAAGAQGSCSSDATCGATAHKGAPAGHANCSPAAHCGATAHGDAGTSAH